MLESTAVVALVIALAAVVFLFFGAGHLLATPWGRRTLLLGAALLPLAASAGSFKAGVAESSRTRFCLSCHEMQSYGKSLFVDNRKALPAVHFQDRLVDRDNACYACHTDYALFGDVKAKLNGLRHVYVHYLGTVPDKIALYQPYPNYNCLHCHEDARGFLEAPAHQAVQKPIATGELSCLKCHAVGHDLDAVVEHRFWQGAMIMANQRRLRVGLLLVMAGLSAQIAASFFWTPGTFILSAAIGAPLVVVGAVLSWLGTRGAP